MSTSRRNFLKKGTMVALAAGVPLGLAEHAIAGIKDSGLGSSATRASLGQYAAFNKKAFAELVNTDFLVTNGSVRAELELVAVTDLARPENFNAKSGREGFSLTFRGKGLQALKQDTYELKHQKLGSTTFLMAPTSNPEKGPLFYEIIVNRLYA